MSPSTSGRKVLLIGTTVLCGSLLGAVAAAGSGEPSLDVATGGEPAAAPVALRTPAPYRPLAASDPVTVTVATEPSTTATTAAVAETTTSSSEPAATAEAATVAEAPPATTPTTAEASTVEPPTTAAPAPDAGPAPSPDPAPESTTTTTATTVPPTTAAPAPDPATMSVEDAIRAWFPDRYSQAYSVARCESGLNPGAVSPGGGNHGLFQINSVHRSDFTRVTGQPWSSIYNAYYNSQYARTIYNQSGWSAWGCRP